MDPKRRKARSARRMIKATAPAKVNLALHVLGRRKSDGYHLLDSLVAFAECEDGLGYAAQAAQAGWSMDVFGPYAMGVPEDGSNLVTQVAQFMAMHFERHAIGTMHLLKDLPHGAGLGGGSMDAAATAWILAAAWKLDQQQRAQLPALLLPLGAELPLALAAWHSGWQRMEGVGESITPLSPLSAEVHAVLTHAGETLSTLAVYAACRPEDYREAMPDTLPQCNDTTALAEWLRENTHNGLEAAACRIGTSVPQQLEALRDTAECLLARMSGSGSACFALYPSGNAAQNAAEWLRERQPAWWVQPTRLGCMPAIPIES